MADSGETIVFDQSFAAVGSSYISRNADQETPPSVSG